MIVSVSRLVSGPHARGLVVFGRILARLLEIIDPVGAQRRDEPEVRTVEPGTPDGPEARSR